MYRAWEERRLHRKQHALPLEPETIAIHPQLFDRYRREIEQLERGLADRLAAAASPAALAIREMIETATVRRQSIGQTTVDIAGSLAATLKRSENKVCGLMVAEERLTPSPHSSPLRFTLRVAA